MSAHGLPAEVRFWCYVDKTDGCWEWTGGKNQKGYGLFSPTQKSSIAAHRYSFKLSGQELTAGLMLDHKCRNRACVNPQHLREVTAAENIQNQDGHRDSKSGRRGVAYDSRTGKWRAKVTKNGKTHSAGPFTDVDEAAEAARQLRLSLFTHNDLDRKEQAA